MLRVELLNASSHQILPAWLHGGSHGARVQRSDLAYEITALHLQPLFSRETMKI